MSLEVATTILKQLGGNRFVVMTGAKHVVGGEDFLQFTLPARTKNRANKCRITLTPMDYYTMAFFRYSPKTGETTALEEIEDLCWDQLQDVFTKATGLYTTL